MAARSDTASTPGPKNGVFMSVSLVSSSSNSLTLSQNHQINTRKHIYDRQSLLEIGMNLPVDCSNLYKAGQTVSGIYSIYPAGDIPVWVYCEMISDGKDEDKGGWTVIQRRMDGSVNFYRPWKQTFHRCLLLLYSVMLVFLAALLSVALVSGCSDSLSYHNGFKFSTFDKDQDVSENNCAKQYLGGFWYSACHNTNPNGVYLWGEDPTLYAIGNVWSTWKGYTVGMKSISMKIKRVS
ncbi:microfibril-associated glycoprotein 4-like [Sinocyclocheilus rhinocerous]|uniref:microfibril-associated glycoprotein 4-like n=1 Tax=Sinocyclocheilus rhinocerous TaxID=307959 RepID=UPI0007B7FBF8|nr:PREDICTED: microfibril-associated glycoprotein 4-like [Sinocyclocheilus rhinocerous]